MFDVNHASPNLAHKLYNTVSLISLYSRVCDCVSVAICIVLCAEGQRHFCGSTEAGRSGMAGIGNAAECSCAAWASAVYLSSDANGAVR